MASVPEVGFSLEGPASVIGEGQYARVIDCVMVSQGVRRRVAVKILPLTKGEEYGPPRKIGLSEVQVSELALSAQARASPRLCAPLAAFMTGPKKRLSATARLPPLRALLDNRDVALVLPLGLCDAERALRSTWTEDARPGMAPDICALWIRDALEAVDAMHRAGSFHRDVKLGNLIVDEQGRLMLADFGLSRYGCAAGVSGLSSTVCTATDRAPEVCRASIDKGAVLGALVEGALTLSSGGLESGGTIAAQATELVSSGAVAESVPTST